MFRKLICTAMLAFILLAGTALASDEYPQPYTGDLVGTWAFAGGAEEHGDGFRLHADGNGVRLEAADYAENPLRTLTETDSTFTWEVVREADKTLLVETDSDGRVFTCEVETYGDMRIHIPNEVSGGFYYPLLDGELAAYLADKAEPSAFDGVLADYLNGSITEKLEAVGLPVSELCLLQEDGAWRIVFISSCQSSGLEYRFILAEEDVTILADEWCWLWGDYDLGQPWFAPRETERYYTMLPGVLESYLSWEYNTPAPTPEPTPAALPELTARLGSFPPNQSYPVYEIYIAEGEDNRRAGNGKAKVSTNGDIEVYAAWQGKLLVEYEIDWRTHRIGWIDAAPLPDSALQGVPELPSNWEDNRYGVVTAYALMTDDPLWSHNPIAYVPAGTSVYALASLDNWLLVECFVNQELRMGFIHSDQVDMEHGYAKDAVRSIDQATRYTEDDIHAAMDAVAAYVEDCWEGTVLIEIRYIEADSADPAAWWQDEEGVLEGMLFYTDLGSMEMWFGEVARYDVAPDWQFILYREPGGEWYVANMGYT